MDWTDEKYQEQLLVRGCRNWLDAGAICSDRKAQGRLDFGRSSGDVGKQVLCAGPSEVLRRSRSLAEERGRGGSLHLSLELREVIRLEIQI